jgi:tetrahydromethanopterin S-methyltransferase subunit H
MRDIQPHIQQLTADPETIRANFIRLWGTMKNAIEITGLAKQAIYNSINNGKITDTIVGRLYKMGIDPRELIKDIEA